MNNKYILCIYYRFIKLSLLIIRKMCFTPAVSLTTAIIEFLIVIYLFKVIKDKRLRVLPYFVFFLGLYQFTEFMLCTSGNLFWSRLGFASYTILPILGMQLFYDLAKEKLSKLFYAIPLAFMLFAIIDPSFIISAGCVAFYVQAKNIVFSENLIFMWIYLAYYVLCPGYGLYHLTKNQKNNRKFGKGWKMRLGFYLAPATVILSEIILVISMLNNLDYNIPWILTSVLVIIASISLILLSLMHTPKRLFTNLIISMIFISGIIAVTLYGIYPAIGYEFASVYCHFALLYSLMAILMVETIQK